MRQVSNQVPGGFLWQLFGIGGGHNRPPLSLRTVWPHINLQSPPRLLVAIPETSHYLYPYSRALLLFPPFASRHGCLIRRAYLAYLVPPGMGGLQSHHVAHPKLAQRLLETLVLAVERVGHHRAKRDALFDGLLHQLGSYLELGAELEIVLASLEVMRGGVGLEVNGPVDLLVCKQAAYTYHPVLGLADVCKPLSAHVRRMLAPLAVPMLVYYQDTLLARSDRTLFEQELQPALVNLLWVPPRF